MATIQPKILLFRAQENGLVYYKFPDGRIGQVTMGQLNTFKIPEAANYQPKLMGLDNKTDLNLKFIPTTDGIPTYQIIQFPSQQTNSSGGGGFVLVGPTGPTGATGSGGGTGGGGDAWLTTGNTGTDSSVNFLGTNDAQNLTFKVNGATSGIIDQTSAQNTFFGYQSGQSISPVAANNTGFGFNSLSNIVGGSNNTAFGTLSLSVVNGGFNNTAIGFDAMGTTSIGSENTAVGSRALLVNTTGNINNAHGHASLQANVSGNSNNAYGGESLVANISGNFNAAFGNMALANNITGNNNVAIGDSALKNSSVDDNTAIGFNSMFTNISGNNCVAVGKFSMYFQTTGSGNVGIGFQALGFNTSGNDNTAIGNNAGVGGAPVAATNRTAIGANTQSTVDNSMYFGNSIVHYNFNPLQQFANNAGALGGGLNAGDFYVVTGSDPRQTAQVF